MKTIRFTLLFLSLMSMLATSPGRAQSIGSDPGHKEYVSLGGIQFSCPQQFTLQRQQSNDTLAYMQNSEYGLDLFVSITNQKVDRESIQQLAGTLSANLLPKEKPSFKWKRLDAYQKMSQFESAGEMLQGFNGNKRLFVQYRKLQIQGKEVVVGYLFTVDEGAMAKQLFDANLGGDSIPGSYAQAHIIASITKEKFDTLTRGGMISAPPPPR